MRLARWLAVALCSTALAACSGEDASRARAEGTPPPRSPFGSVLAYAVAGPDLVFAVTDVAGCPTCASLWRWSDAAPEWQRVHDFGAAEEPLTDETIEYPPVHPWSLAMATDGQHGYLSWDAEGLQMTSDGGRSWQPVEIPDAPGEVGEGAPGITGDHALLLVERPCTTDVCTAGDLWRTTLGDDAWERVDQPPGYWHELATSGDSVLVKAIVDGEDRLYRTTDAAGTWREVRAPRNTAPGSIGPCAPFATGESVSVVSCLTGPDGLHQLRTSDDGGRTWRDLVTLGTHEHSAEYADQVLALGTDRFLVSTQKRTLLLDRAGRSVASTDLPRRVSAGTCTDRRTCVVVAAPGQLWRTVDAGATWRVLAGKGGTNG